MIWVDTIANHLRAGWERSRRWVGTLGAITFVGLSFHALVFGAPHAGYMWLYDLTWLLPATHGRADEERAVTFQWTLYLRSFRFLAWVPMVPTWVVWELSDQNRGLSFTVCLATMLVFSPLFVDDFYRYRRLHQRNAEQALSTALRRTRRNGYDTVYGARGYKVMDDWMRLPLPMDRKLLLIRYRIRPEDAMTPEVMGMSETEFAAMDALSAMGSRTTLN